MILSSLQPLYEAIEIKGISNWEGEVIYAWDCEALD